jgi:hypothetical protein
MYFQRKQEKEIALYGKVVSSENADGEDGDGDGMDDDLSAPAPGEYRDEINFTAVPGMMFDDPIVP